MFHRIWGPAVGIFAIMLALALPQAGHRSVDRARMDVELAMPMFVQSLQVPELPRKNRLPAEIRRAPEPQAHSPVRGPESNLP